MAKQTRVTAVADVNGDAVFTSPTNKQVRIVRVESPAGNVATEVDIISNTTVANLITNTGPDVVVSFPVGLLGATVKVLCPAGANGATLAVTWEYNK